MPKNTQKFVCYIDCLGLISFFRLITLRRKAELAQIHYCSTTPFLRWVKGLPVFGRYFQRCLKEFVFEPGDMLLDDGDSVFWREFQDSSLLSVEIANKAEIGKFLVEYLNPSYEREKVQLFLTQKICFDIGETLRLILAAHAADIKNRLFLRICG